MKVQTTWTGLAKKYCRVQWTLYVHPNPAELLFRSLWIWETIHQWELVKPDWLWVEQLLRSVSALWEWESAWSQALLLPLLFVLTPSILHLVIIKVFLRDIPFDSNGPHHGHYNPKERLVAGVHPVFPGAVFPGAFSITTGTMYGSSGKNYFSNWNP